MIRKIRSRAAPTRLGARPAATAREAPRLLPRVVLVAVAVAAAARAGVLRVAPVELAVRVALGEPAVPVAGAGELAAGAGEPGVPDDLALREAGPNQCGCKPAVAHRDLETPVADKMNIADESIYANRSSSFPWRSAPCELCFQPAA